MTLGHMQLKFKVKGEGQSGMQSIDGWPRLTVTQGSAALNDWQAVGTATVQ